MLLPRGLPLLAALEGLVSLETLSPALDALAALASLQVLVSWETLNPRPSPTCPGFSAGPGLARQG